MTKVTFILTQDLTSPSGLGRYWPMARELTRLGHRTRVVALHSDYCSLFQKTVWKEGVEINYVAQMHVLKKGNLKAYFPLRKLCSVVLTATWKLSVSCLKDDSEIFIVGKPHPMNGIAGLLVRYIKKKVMFLDCDDYEIGVNRYSHEWQRKFAGFFENFLPRHADLVTTNTHFTMQRLLAQGVKKEKILYISNGYDEERFFPPDEEEIERLRQSLNLEGKKVIGFIGTLGITSHPVDLLIRAFLKVREVIPDSILLLVGGGEDIEKLTSVIRGLGIAHWTRFTGRVPAEQVAKYYYLMDVSVDPVFDDNAAKGRSPLKMFESWICGVPFITGNVGDRSILAGDPPAAHLVNPGDIDQLAAGLVKILSDSSLSIALRQAGLKKAKEYSWSRIIEAAQSYFNVSTG